VPKKRVAVITPFFSELRSLVSKNHILVLSAKPRAAECSSNYRKNAPDRHHDEYSYHTPQKMAFTGSAGLWVIGLKQQINHPTGKKDKGEGKKKQKNWPNDGVINVRDKNLELLHPVRGKLRS
jgi:hypothetical protein